MSSVASGADWVLLGQDKRGNVWHVDRQSVALENEVVMSWKRIEFKEPKPQSANGSTIQWALLFDATHCKERRVGIKTIKLLDADDQVIGAFGHGDPGIHWPVNPHVVLLAQGMAAVCSQAGLPSGG